MSVRNTSAFGGEMRMTSTRPMGAAGWRPYVPAVLCAVAGIIHLAIAPQHFAEAFSMGLFMLAAGVAQLVVAVQLWRRPSPRVTAVAVVGTLVLLITYLLSRTTGLPFGPDPWTREAAHLPDLACKVSEVALLLALAMGWHRRPQRIGNLAEGFDPSTTDAART